MSGAEVMAGLYAAFGKGDVPTVLAAMDPQIQWTEAEGNPYRTGDQPWVGPDAVVANLFMKLGSEWAPFEVHPGTYHDAGDSVTVEGRYTGVFKATGRSLDAPFCHVWTLKDGKIVTFQQYTDTAQMQHVMGYLERAASSAR